MTLSQLTKRAKAVGVSGDDLDDADDADNPKGAVIELILTILSKPRGCAMSLASDVPSEPRGRTSPMQREGSSKLPLVGGDLDTQQAALKAVHRRWQEAENDFKQAESRGRATSATSSQSSDPGSVASNATTVKSQSAVKAVHQRWAEAEEDYMYQQAEPRSRNSPRSEASSVASSKMSSPEKDAAKDTYLARLRRDDSDSEDAAALAWGSGLPGCLPARY